MSNEDEAKRKLDEFLRQTKTLTLNSVIQRLGAGSAILQAAGFTALALLVTDCKQLEDQLESMHPGKFTDETQQLQQQYGEIKDRIDEVMQAHIQLLGNLIALMPADNRETIREMFLNTESKVREIVKMGLGSALVARKIFNDETEFDRFIQSNAIQ